MTWFDDIIDQNKASNMTLLLTTKQQNWQWVNSFPQVEMLNATMKEVEKKYDCCKDVYQHIEMDLTFKYNTSE